MAEAPMLSGASSIRTDILITPSDDKGRVTCVLPRLTIPLAFYLSLSSACSAPSRPPHVAQGADDERARLSNIIVEARSQFQIPAVAVAVIRSDTIIAAADGLAGGDNLRAEVHSRFMLGSLTKPLTSTLIGTLVDEGRLDWQTRIIDVFPELKDSILPGYWSVTVEQLLEHRAGVAPMDSHFLDGIPETGGSPATQRYAYVTWLLRKRPLSAPGTTFRYSNGGYSIAGAMAERVSGRSLEQLFRDRLFSPLQLHSAGFDPAEWQYVTEPVGHATLGPWQSARIPDSYSARDRMLNRAAGNLHMSVADLATFAQTHLRALRGLPAPLLRPETYASLHRPNGEYAKGWVIEVDGRDTISWHNGTDGRSKSYLALRPGRDVGVAILMNVGGERADKALWFIEREVLKGYPRAASLSLSADSLRHGGR
jgi:CubicO group peptidase (beta-lactamase class C family)